MKWVIFEVYSRLHFDRYITMDDKVQEKMIVQMGIQDDKPTDIRDCLEKIKWL